MATRTEQEKQVLARSADQVIKSAETVTLMRALMAQESDASARNPDHLAIQFLSPKLRLLCKVFPLGKLIADLRAPGAVGYHLARTKHVDRLLLAALDQGIEQLVILGAGNDSRPYRFADRLRGVRVFEVDFPGTQAQKKARLAHIFGKLPESVTFVPIDFNKQSLYEALSAAGYDATKKTFVNWEGVSYYITEEAVDRVLGFVAKHAGRGSEIVFDYALRSFVDGDHSMFGASGFARWLLRVGEPFLFSVKEGDMGAFARARGLEAVSDLTAEELEQRYVRRSDGRPYARIFGMFRIANLRLP